MNRATARLLALAILLIAPLTWAGECRIVDLEMASELVPAPVKFSVLLPPDYEKASGPLPLLINLHGGGGSRDMLKTQRGIFDDVWKGGSVPPMVVAMPSAASTWTSAMDRKSGRHS